MVIIRLETKPVVDDSFQRLCSSLSWKATTPSQLMLTHDYLVHPFKNYFVPDTDRELEKVLYKPKVVENFK